MTDPDLSSLRKGAEVAVGHNLVRETFAYHLANAENGLCKIPRRVADDLMQSYVQLEIKASREASLREALEEIATHDCGCVPCTHQCLKGEAAEIELEHRMAIARTALIQEGGR